MKIALYIEDGLEQIVLTPETKTEDTLLGKLHDGSRDLSIKRGAFYHCNGGWMRQAPIRAEFRQQDDDCSTMIVLRRRPSQPTEK